MPHPADEALEQAARAGVFSNLANSGKPLNLDEYFETPEDLRMAYSILKNADTPPEEIGLLREIAELRERIAGERDPARQAALRRDLRDRTLKKDILMERLGRR